MLELTDYHWDANEAFTGERLEPAGEKFTQVMTRIDELLWHIVFTTDQTIDGVLALVKNYVDAEIVGTDELKRAYEGIVPGGSSETSVDGSGN